MINRFTHAKIVCTIGPATNSEEKIRKLFESGVDVFRLNTSHGKMESHSKAIRLIRSIEQELGVHVAILLDLQGPKIRVGNLPYPLMLTEGQRIKMMSTAHTKDEDKIPVDYSGFVEDVAVGNRVLINDGRISLIIREKQNDAVVAEVIDGGEVQSRKGVNIPDANLNVEVLSDRDRQYIRFGIEQDVDFFALSFVRTPEDIINTKAVITQKGGNIPIIAKIEKPQAVGNIIDILDVSDGIMVARGDLGIELAPEKVPMVQKRLVKLANEKKKAVIVATQMLESMINEPIPTRAEANDVANAIIDGTDAVMLSGETAIGKHPIKAVKIMDEICQNVEASDYYRELHRLYTAHDLKRSDPYFNDLVITRMLDEKNVKAIVVITRTGYTARILSKAKIAAPIIACTGDLKLCRQLNLLSGVLTQQIDIPDVIQDSYLDELVQQLKCRKLYDSGDIVACLVGFPFFMPDQTSIIRVKKVN